MKRAILAVSFACLASACSSSGVVGTYDCPRGRSIDQLQLFGDGKAVWTYMPQGKEKEFRYEAKDADVRIFRSADDVAKADLSGMDPLSRSRAEGELNRAIWRFQFHDGNLRNLQRASESCTRK